MPGSCIAANTWENSVLIYTTSSEEENNTEKGFEPTCKSQNTVCLFLTDTQSKCFVSETLILLQSNIHNSGDRKKMVSKAILKTLFFLFWYLH